MRIASMLLAAAMVLTALPSIASADDFPFKEAGQLTWEGDIASRMIDGIDRFLLRKTESSQASPRRWRPDRSSPEALAASVRTAREELAHLLGVRDDRVPFSDLPLVATVGQSAKVGESERVAIYRVRWPVVARVTCEGLLLVPKGKIIADIVAVPDADQLPGDISGWGDGPQYALCLAEAGCRVVVPTLFGRTIEARNGRARLTDREFIYRITFELGRHPIGYEVESILAIVDWFQADTQLKRPIGVLGWGEGGQAAFFAAALDERIGTAGVAGFFGDRRVMWKEPIDRSLFGFVERFGAAEVAAMIAPRSVVIDGSSAPQVTVAKGEGGAPGAIVSPSGKEIEAEVERAKELAGPAAARSIRVVSLDTAAVPWRPAALQAFLNAATKRDARLVDRLSPPRRLHALPDRSTIRRRQLAEMRDESRRLLEASRGVRKAFWSKADYRSLDRYRESTRFYREFFARDVIGRFDEKLLPARPRMRQLFKRNGFTAYEVVLDVFPDLFAYGILLWPEGITPRDRRPVVVCQHGLEGRPLDTIEGDHRAYHDFAAKLAREGFVVFAPQNIYLFGDRFRTLQRKANPLKKSLFSIMVPQHDQITRWLGGLPGVDRARIGFYGLSYGGKSAMRIPALVDRYCLSICSADFNEWVWKNVDTRDNYSYVWTGEYEIYEFDLGSTFNYAEMASLICPRPFMVERGHFDGVAPDEMVAYEYAKIRNLYAARLGIPDRTAIEWFVGPHMINGKGTFEFLRKHLRWPEKDSTGDR